MPQVEKKDEKEAREIVEEELGVELEFADLNGDVDYRFVRDGKDAVLEVSRLTREDHRQGDYEWGRTVKSFEAPWLRNHWIVVSEGYPQFSGLWEALGPAIRDLEVHRISRYGESMDWWLRHVPTLEAALEVFRERKVQAAHPISGDPNSQEAGSTKIYLAVSDSWRSDGPNGAVEELNRQLNDRVAKSKFRKLESAHVDECHIWFWVDSFSISRLREPVRDEDHHLNLPDVPPDLPRFVSHLWLVDDVAKHGWIWADGKWAWINR